MLVLNFYNLQNELMKKMEKALQRKTSSSDMKLEKKRKWSEEAASEDHKVPRMEVRF